MIKLIMYNLFIKEKKEKEFSNQVEKEIKDKEEKVKRKNKNKKLVEKYDDRIKHFLFEMAKNPVQIRDYINPIQTVRNDIDSEDNSTPKHFIYKGFQTDKQRIEKYLAEKRIVEESLEKNDRHFFKRHEPEEIFQQPQMRFKARNRIERVFDTINEQSYGKVDRNVILKSFKTKLKKKIGFQNYTDILEQQLPKYLIYNINKLKNEREKENKTEEEEYSDEEKRFFIRTDTNFFTEKDKADRKSISQSNFYKNYVAKNQSASQAMKLLSEKNNVKTHFKGASNFAMVHAKKQHSPEQPKLDLTKEQSNIEELHAKTQEQASPSSIRSKKRFPTNHINSHNEKLNSIINDDLNKDIIKNFPLLYNVNTNNILKEKKFTDQTVLQKLKRMSERPFLVEEKKEDPKKKKKIDFKKIFKKKTDPNEEVTNNKLLSSRFIGDIYKVSIDYFEEELKKKDQDRITIDNKVYTKDQMDEIAKYILKKCNYIHDKNKKHEATVKAGEGKLMITGGMTVSEFLKKYNFKK